MRPMVPYFYKIDCLLIVGFGNSALFPLSNGKVGDV